jgi:hypothetical protein
MSATPPARARFAITRFTRDRVGSSPTIRRALWRTPGRLLDGGADVNTTDGGEGEDACLNPRQQPSGRSTASFRKPCHGPAATGMASPILNMAFVPRRCRYRACVKPRYRDKSDSKHNPNNGASNRSGPESLFKVGGRKRHVCRLLYSQAQGRPDGWHHLS